MRAKFPRTLITAAAAGLAVAAGPLAAQAASASVSGTVFVPCNPTTLATDLAGASSGEVLMLASNCTYVLTSALPDITTDLTLRGFASTLERSLTGSPPDFSLLDVTSAVDVNISGLNFVNGAAADEGGAIDNDDDGALTVSGGTFSGNTSGEYGGAIYNDGFLSLSGATFTGNTAPGWYGGAIYNDYDAAISRSTFTGNSAWEGGAVYSDYNTVLANSVFSGNSASEYGGGLYINDDGITNVSATSFTGNTAEYGGGAYNYGYGATFVNTQFTSNQASDEGGGIYNDEYLTLTGGSLTRNTAPYGGGVYDDSDLVTTGATLFTGNTAEEGGGLYVDEYATVTGAIFQRNTASDDGGGIFMDGDHLTLQNSTITTNGAPSGDGGGVYNDEGLGYVSLIGTNMITRNYGGNCAPTSSVDGCTG
jgi:predicted outer membrane repeat protein